jgi:hypothetical protein
MINWGKLVEFGQKNLLQCNFAHHKSHTESSSLNPSLFGDKFASNRLSYDTARYSPQYHYKRNELQITQLQIGLFYLQALRSV